MRKHLSFIALAASLVLVGAGCAGGAPAPSAGGPGGGNAVTAPPATPPAAPPPSAVQPPPVVGPTTITVSMRPRGGDKEYGTAIISRVDANHSKVVVTLANAPTKSAEDVGLFSGPCSSVSAPQQYDLSAMIKGRSETTLNVDFKSFVGGTEQSIRVVEKPLNAQSSFWACGDIK